MVRIIKRTAPDGGVKYYIQRKTLWFWSDVCKSIGEIALTLSFDTLDKARANLCWYDGTRYKDEIVK